MQLRTIIIYNRRRRTSLDINLTHNTLTYNVTI